MQTDPPGGMPPGAGAPFRPPMVNQQEKLKLVSFYPQNHLLINIPFQWLELGGANDEVWVETKIPDGSKPYYYNALTRVTVWHKPTGDKCRIVDQAGLQALVDAGMKIEREKNRQGKLEF